MRKVSLKEIERLKHRHGLKIDFHKIEQHLIKSCVHFRAKINVTNAQHMCVSLPCYACGLNLNFQNWNMKQSWFALINYESVFIFRFDSCVVLIMSFLCANLNGAAIKIKSHNQNNRHIVLRHVWLMTFIWFELLLQLSGWCSAPPLHFYLLILDFPRMV